MVQIIDYKQRVNAAGETFYSLLVEGEIEILQSGATGNFYATAKKASIVSTFNEATCQKLIGTELPGRILKVACPEYAWEVPGTNETVMLNYTYMYSPEPSTIEETVFGGHPIPAR
ncbi:MAG: hypothetical protein PHD61_11395 [Bacteroidales bacterium]|nr:hypothetical protein [Lentimicrobiaceae bacterium]MDD5695893.1 hypothetical protein [Bacteroidales bacterium]